MKVTFEIPDETAKLLGLTEENVTRKLLEDAVAQAYRDGKLSMHGVAEALSLPTRMHADPFLLKYGIFDYTPEMLEKDVETLEKIRAERSGEFAAR